MARHHTVQEAYLNQWLPKGRTQLNIYVIPDNECIERGAAWKGFWKHDYNVLIDEDGTSDLPEEVTEVVDTKGIEAIRAIDAVAQTQLSSEHRSAIAFYVALQYIRTPRYREEMDKWIEATTLYFMRRNLASPSSVHMSKEEIMRHQPKNKREEEALRIIGGMSQEEIDVQLFQTIHGEDIRVGLSKTGHAKGILKVEKYAKDLFEIQWLFLVAPESTAFVTSDNPCFTISSHGMINGLSSPFSTVVFPLRPDVCIYMKPGSKSKTEHFMSLTEQEVEEMNRLIMAHSYESVVAGDLKQLEGLLKDFDCKSHRRSRDVHISERDPYTAFTLR